MPFPSPNPGDESVPLPIVTARQHAAILAGLRLLQHLLENDDPLPAFVEDVLTDAGRIRTPLSVAPRVTHIEGGVQTHNVPSPAHDQFDVLIARLNPPSK